MRSIAFIWAVAVISAALAQGASAQEKIQLAQSSTVTNCNDELQLASDELPNHLCRGHAASPFPAPAAVHPPLLMRRQIPPAC